MGTKSADYPPWVKHFYIQSEAELDFVIGQGTRFPVGMPRYSPPEFKRRVLSATTSYLLGLKSIDHVRRCHVEPDLYETDDPLLGDIASDYLKKSIDTLVEELFNLHTIDTLAFGVFGAEITLYRVPYTIGVARMLSNRGLFLEVLPILRLCLEMMAWANVAFHVEDRSKLTALKAQSCMSELKHTYSTAGKIYGYLSEFAHWGHVIHRDFISVIDEKTAVLNASARYRAMSLALCLIAVDVLVEVVRALYGEKSDSLVVAVQGCVERNSARKTYSMLSAIVEKAQLDELLKIQALLV